MKKSNTVSGFSFCVKRFFNVKISTFDGRMFKVLDGGFPGQDAYKNVFKCKIRHNYISLSIALCVHNHRDYVMRIHSYVGIVSNTI